MKILSPVLGVGSALLDLLVNVDEEQLSTVGGEKGGMELVSSSRIDELAARLKPDRKAPGGSAANTIVGLGKLGVRVGLLSKVGNDPDGEFYRNYIGSLGGDTAPLLLDSETHTGRCLSMITADSERTMRTDLGAAAKIGATDVQQDFFANAGHVHIEGYILFSPDYCLKVMRTAKAHGCTVSFDMASFEVVGANCSLLPELLDKYVDIVFANEDEAAEFCATNNIQEQLDILGSHCRCVGLKQGRDGCILRCDGEDCRCEAQKVAAVDTTGAGDFWQAGFLYGMSIGAPLAECGRFGSFLGAEAVKIIGTDIAPERWSRIKELLSCRPD